MIDIIDNSDKKLTSVPANLNELAAKLNVIDKSGNSIDFEKVVIEMGANRDDESFVTLNSIGALRALEPNLHGEIAEVLSWQEGTGYGGGIFTYDMSDKSTAEDYGVTIVTAKGARWKRYLAKPSALSVVDFGAIPDGKTDCLDAVTRMWNWSRVPDAATNTLPHENVGVHFPSGHFYISKFDISATEIGRFRLSGNHVNFGYFPTTKLTSDKKEGEYMFTVNARWVSIYGITIDGEDNTKNKGFFKNTIQGGQYIRVTGMQFNNMGGRSLDLLDTLDCKIDQWYARRCAGTVVYGRWSDRVAGSWDHITAIELSNFNIQYGTQSEMIDLQRATQCIINNGWIEHTEFPGNISNGQWSIQALNLEDNTHPLKCHYSRIISTMLNVHDGEGMDFSETGARWLSVYEGGQTWIESHGLKLEGSLNYQYITSPDRMDNRRDQETWFKVGEIEVPEWTTQLQMRIVGSSQFAAMGETQTDYTTRTPEGEAKISIQNVNGQFITSWAGEGSCPVTRVMVKNLGSSKAAVFVKIAKFTGFCIALITTNCFDRFSRGVHFRFDKSYTMLSTTEAAALDAETDTAFKQHWTGVESVGYGYNHNNDLLMRGRVVNTTATGTATECLRVMVNGRAYGIELKPINA